MTGSFSVAMCTYNGERFVEEQLASIAAQTLLPEELVVCDDVSSDETARIVESFATDAPFPVRLHVNATNLGSTRNFERAVGLCAGALIALCDQDDVWVPRKLERLAAEFARRPEVGLVFSDAELIDELSRPTGRKLWESIGFRNKEQKRLTGIDAFRDLLTGSTVTGATTAFRARFRSLVLPIPEELALIHDGWLALLVGAVAGISFIAEPLVKYRQHGGQQVGPLARKDPGRGVSDALQRANPYVETLAIARSVRQRLLDKHDTFDVGKTLPDLEARIAHLEARASLPKGHLQRSQRVLRELLTSRYHLYSNGVYSAIKDLLA
ncbi:MAG: glycosyltransferase family 2 protein [Pyrinomonadaceae bacterium]